MLLARFEQKQQQFQQQQQFQLQQQFQQQQFQQQQPGQQYSSSQGVYNMAGPPGQMGQSLIRPMQQQQQPQPIGMVRPQGMPTQHLNFLLADMISKFEAFFYDITPEKREVWLFRTTSNCYYMLLVL